MGAGPLEAAAQRVPPVHGRSAPVGGGGQRGRTGRAWSRDPTCSCSVRCSTTSARGTRVITPKSAWSWSASSGRGSGYDRRRRRRRWSRWSNTISCCPTSRCVATSPTRRRLSSSPGGRPVERLELLHALTEADSKATGPSAWGRGRRNWSTNSSSAYTTCSVGATSPEVTWPLFPDAETLALMAVGESTSLVEDDRITVVYPDSARGVQPDRRRALAPRPRRDDRPRPLRRAVAMAASQFRIASVDR